MIGVNDYRILTEEYVDSVADLEWLDLSGRGRYLEEIVGKDVMVGFIIDSDGKKTNIFADTPEWIRRDLDRYN